MAEYQQVEPTEDELQERRVQVYGYLQADKIMTQIEYALGDRLPVQRFIRSVYTAMMQNQDLMYVTRQSLFASMIAMAQLLLEPVLGRAWLIPYKNRQKKGEPLEAQFQLGWKGVTELCYRTNRIAKIVPRTIWKGDKFEIHYGTVDQLVHVPDLNREHKEKEYAPPDAVGFYSVFFFRDGCPPSFLIQTLADIEKLRTSSPSSKSPAWRNWYEQMAHAKTTKRKGKTEQLSIEYQWGAHLDDLSDGGASQLPAITAMTGKDLDRDSDPEAATPGTVQVHPETPTGEQPPGGVGAGPSAQDLIAIWTREVTQLCGEMKLTGAQVEAYMQLAVDAGRYKKLDDVKIAVAKSKEYRPFMEQVKKYVESSPPAGEEPEGKKPPKEEKPETKETPSTVDPNVPPKPWQEMSPEEKARFEAGCDLRKVEQSLAFLMFQALRKPGFKPFMERHPEWKECNETIQKAMRKKFTTLYGGDMTADQYMESLAANQPEEAAKKEPGEEPIEETVVDPTLGEEATGEAAAGPEQPAKKQEDTGGEDPQGADPAVEAQLKEVSEFESSILMPHEKFMRWCREKGYTMENDTFRISFFGATRILAGIRDDRQGLINEIVEWHNKTYPGKEGE